MLSRREFTGPWISSSSNHPTRPDHASKVVVDKSPYSTQDIYVAAGCQQGLLHCSTALDLAINLMEAVQEMIPDISLEHSFEVHGPREFLATFRGVHHVEVRNHFWSLYGIDNSLISGPHAAAGWWFRIIPDPQIERVRNFFSKKGGE